MLKTWFHSLARNVSRYTGTAGCFALAAGCVLVWAITGPYFHYSDNWQLVINTGTTIVTFLMVFLIQNAQNRDTDAIHIKLDELIRSTEGAHNVLMDLEELDPEKLAAFRQAYAQHAGRAKDPDDRAVSAHGIEEVRLDQVDAGHRTDEASTPAVAPAPGR